jgi:2-(1,2-epoxy-1,2-dihydrophenyl)acetyl-CoA isomerase
MDYEQITYEQRGRVGLVTLNRPEKLNAWTDRMMREMRHAMDGACAEPTVGAIVVTGAGRAFCAGADISTFRAAAEAQDEGKSRGDSDATAPGTNWVSYLQELSKPTIAAVNGVAVGIGVTQILPMDIRIAADSARFGMFFVKMGLVPELASSALLPQMVGSARALEWCLTGRLIPAEEACSAGLVAEVVPAAGLLDRALALGEALASNAAPSMVLIRRLLRENANKDDVVAVMRSEGEALNVAYSSWEHREAIAAFFEKRPADFSKKPA